ncbi:hypothetical protein BVC80_1711g32 [Macleaya cordata]|uniref:Uncharacterized protein n=1 Tax=Macleaya cordata TaxID=56857 RepID=A0A200Q2E9_MACCD|nr:hypothetical protein BVC80_1711g32 [Macleaya cordata]
MATPPLFNSSNKVRTSTSFSDKTRGRSKTQMCLKKIIDIISSGSSIQAREIFKRISANPISDESKNEEKGLGEKARDLFTEKRGFGIDLNLRLGPPLESENLTVNKGFSACSGVGDGDGKVCGISIDCNSSVVCCEYLNVDKSSEGECDPKEVGNSTEDFPETEVNKEEEEQGVIEEERREFSEITNLPEIETERVRDETEDGEQSEIKAVEEEEEEEEDEELEDEEEEVVEVDEREKQKDEEKRSLWRRNSKNEGYLDLLVEAARLISGNFEDDETDEEGKRRLSMESTEKTVKITEAEAGPNKTIGCRSKRNQSWMFDFYEGFEDISPVVRSKRGRNQVLPYRYRDSVLDPWKRFSKQRSSRVSSKTKT